MHTKKVIATFQASSLTLQLCSTVRDRFDSPPQHQRCFLTNVSSSWMLDTRNDTFEKKHSNIFLCAKAYRSTTSGRVSRDDVFQEIRPGAGFETGDFGKEKLNGLPYNDSRLKVLLCKPGKTSQLKNTRAQRSKTKAGVSPPLLFNNSSC